MRTTTVSTWVMLLIACGAESGVPAVRSEEGAAPPPNAAENTAENTLERETAYAIHEWGFIGHHYAATSDARLTSRTAPSPVVTRPAVGLGNLGHGRGGKPVLYVHLQGEGNIARFTASLSTAGRFLEEWPHSEGSTPTSLTWEVEARRGSCSARERYPAADDAHCTGIADHYCEAAELAHYETDDSACLTVDGERWNHLFYRSQLASDLPLRVSKSGDAFTVQVTGTLPGRLMRIRRADDASATRVSLFNAPADGESRPISEPDQPAADGIASLESELSALGMSEDEVGAFMIAWQAELFGETPQRSRVEMVGTPPRDLQPKADALVYFLPRAAVDAMVPLAFTPPPSEVRRAVLVRVDLGDVRAPQPSARSHTNHTLVRIGAVTSDGGYPAEVARRVIRRYINTIRACAEEQLPAGADTQPTLQLVVQADGIMQSASLEGAPAELTTCVQSAAARWRFPTFDTGAWRISTELHVQLREQ